MRRLLAFFFMALVAVLVASLAFAWQPRTIDEGTSSVKFDFYPLTAIQLSRADGVSSIQVANDGPGVLQFSLHRCEDPKVPAKWRPVYPYAAVDSADIYFDVADSVYTLQSGETAYIDNIPSARRPHAIQTTRPSSTAFRVWWK